MDCKAVTCPPEQVQKGVTQKNRLENIYMYLGSHKLKFENVEVDAEDLEKAREELRETPEIVRESLETLRKLVKEETSLNYPTDDDKLQIFLRPCKYYPNSALTRMKKFYKFKFQHPNYSKNLIPSCETRAFTQNLLTILPYRNKRGERILVLEIGQKWKTSSCTLKEILRSAMLIVEAALEEPKTQINGVQVIIDMTGLALQHVWQFTPGFAKHVVDWVQDCIPLRLKGIHIVNQPYVFNMLYAIFKPFLGSKLQKRIVFHGSHFDTLHSHISPSVLPKQYGGDLDIPFDKGAELHKYLERYDSEFQERQIYGYTKAPPKD
ncbi:hypothetical protein RUM43_009008 [Polyplax serrata]|uniref:CRAL-TRIO domain-containing protein n=1 Tax=Polyplax serrata TaxID=468196 RepID=A0AAN8NPH7_POLSC